MKPLYLRTVREKLELTQVTLAELAGVQQNTISKLEATRGARPAYATHTAIARALNIDPDRLTFGPDPRRPRRRAKARRRAGRPRRLTTKRRAPRAATPPAPTPATEATEATEATV